MNQLETIYVVVFKTHVDLGFTDLPSQVAKQYTQEMAHDVLAICEKTAHLQEGHRFVWTVPSWVLDESLKHADSELRLQNVREMATEQTLAFHMRLVSVEQCDLLENEQDTLSIQKDAVTLSFAPREIVTIKIRTS